MVKLILTDSIGTERLRKHYFALCCIMTTNRVPPSKVTRQILTRLLTSMQMYVILLMLTSKERITYPLKKENNNDPLFTNG